MSGHPFNPGQLNPMFPPPVTCAPIVPCPPCQDYDNYLKLKYETLWTLLGVILAISIAYGAGKYYHEVYLPKMRAALAAAREVDEEATS